MARVESQADIVAQMALYHDEGTEVTDKLFLPGLNEWFLRPDFEHEIEVETVRVPGLKQLATKKRVEICDMLTGLPSFRPGLMGFSWRLGEEDLDVFLLKGFEQKQYDNEADLEKLASLFMNILKLRRDMQGIRWDFNQDYLEISYIA
jgi:hypothetical protein